MESNPSVATSLSASARPESRPPGVSWFRRRVPRRVTRRSARFTTEGTRFVLFTLAVGVAAINTGNNLFYLLVAMMLSLIMMSGLLSELCLRRLQVSCHAPDVVYANTRATLTLVLTNPRRRFPSFSLRLAEVVDGRASDRHIHVKHLPPGGSVFAPCPIQVAKRGRYDVDGIQISTPFPFGLFLKRLFLPHPLSLLVLPQPQPVSAEMLTGVLDAGVDHSWPRKGPGVDLYNLRLYQPGDDSRLIHWMSTARTSQLMVRETEAETYPRVTIYLSTIAPPDAHQTFERAVTLTASLVAHCYAHGFHVRLRVGKSTVVSRRIDDDLQRLLIPLALCTSRSPQEMDEEAEEVISEAEGSHREELLLVVLPWSSPALRSRFDRATQIFDVFHYAHLGSANGIGPGFPI